MHWTSNENEFISEGTSSGTEEMIPEINFDDSYVCDKRERKTPKNETKKKMPKLIFQRFLSFYTVKKLLNDKTKNYKMPKRHQNAANVVVTMCNDRQY